MSEPPGNLRGSCWVISYDGYPVGEDRAALNCTLEPEDYCGDATLVYEADEGSGQRQSVWYFPCTGEYVAKFSDGTMDVEWNVLTAIHGLKNGEKVCTEPCE
jgi:hypothetical protein